MQKTVMIEKTVHDESTDLKKRKSLSSKAPKSANQIPDKIIPSPNTQENENNIKLNYSNFISKHEIPRKVFHSSIGFFTLYLYAQGKTQYSHIKYPLGIAFIIIFIIDLIRFKSIKINKLYCKLVGPLMRNKEINSFNGVLWYLLGLTITFTIFERDIGLMCVFLLSWCDTMASLIGRKFGHLTPKIGKDKRKSVAGSLGAFFTGLLVTKLFYGYCIPTYNPRNLPGKLMWTPDTSKLSINWLSIFGGLVASLSEGIDLFGWDDNFTIPVLSGIFLYIVIEFFKIRL